jgi:hypothetical protein
MAGLASRSKFELVDLTTPEQDLPTTTNPLIDLVTPKPVPVVNLSTPKLDQLVALVVDLSTFKLDQLVAPVVDLSTPELDQLVAPVVDLSTPKPDQLVALVVDLSTLELEQLVAALSVSARARVRALTTSQCRPLGL